jgi:hypothetical protein
MQGEMELELIMPKDDGDDQEVQNQPENNENQNANNPKKKRVLKFTDTQGEKTLEKEENLIASQLESELLIDPLFKQTTQKFDEMSLSSLLTSRLNINPELLIQFDSQMPETEIRTFKSSHDDSKMCKQFFLETFNPLDIENDTTSTLCKGLDQYIQL